MVICKLSSLKDLIISLLALSAILPDTSLKTASPSSLCYIYCIVLGVGSKLCKCVIGAWLRLATVACPIWEVLLSDTTPVCVEQSRGATTSLGAVTVVSLNSVH